MPAAASRAVTAASALASVFCRAALALTPRLVPWVGSTSSAKGALLASSETETAEEKTMAIQDDDATYSMHQENDVEEQESEHIESLDEYDDIENLEIKHRDFDRDSDD